MSLGAFNLRNPRYGRQTSFPNPKLTSLTQLRGSGHDVYQVAFRKKIYGTMEELQADLDLWIDSYNDERTHQGKVCCGRTPMATFQAGKEICREKAIA